MGINLAIIPARGGSKSIHKKNIFPIAGKPLIGYSIEHAMASEKIDRVIVSTDDADIAEESRRFGAEVPFMRPAELAADKTPDFPVFDHVLAQLKETENYIPDIVVHLRPTSPIRDVKHIDIAVQMLVDDPTSDSVRSVSVAIQSPFKMWKRQGELIIPFLQHEFDEQNLTAKQYLPKILYHNGCIDVIRASTIVEKKSMTGDRVLPFLMENEEYDVQIDSAFDARIAEMILGSKK